MFENHFYELAVLCVRGVNLQVIKSGDPFAQGVVVSDSAFGSKLPGISNLNLAIACTAMYYRSDKTIDIKRIPQ
jgi:hypothetical protein